MHARLKLGWIEAIPAYLLTPAEDTEGEGEETESETDSVSEPALHG